ncbi:hypothetical protein B0H67DRAFT_567373 [Lasiosphaeris hirsuta]|uniref:Uncharacterized protein n=1 Tax=Lasiosphaeris hirsuta TaxID=260670 RepID=A0AA40AY72_9PEZI|nr:hypothetical protein B0H67DRAFT_567373 [Lasiosphaeris hirsuta]
MSVSPSALSVSSPSLFLLTNSIPLTQGVSNRLDSCGTLGITITLAMCKPSFIHNSPIPKIVLAKVKLDWRFITPDGASDVCPENTSGVYSDLREPIAGPSGSRA